MHAVGNSLIELVLLGQLAQEGCDTLAFSHGPS